MTADERIQALESRVGELEQAVRFIADTLRVDPYSFVNKIGLSSISQGFPLSGRVSLPPGRPGDKSHGH